MSYRVIHPVTGIPVECETPQQVAALIQEFSKAIPQRTSGRVTISEPVGQPWSAYSAYTATNSSTSTHLPLRVAATGTAVAQLQGKSRVLAEALIAHAGQNLSSETLRTVVGSSSVEGLGPSLRWMKPNFTAVGVDLDQILQRTPGQAATWTIIPSDHLLKLKSLTSLTEGSS